MDIYTRVENLEKLVDSLATTINNTKFYTDADIAGCRNTDIELSDQIEAVTPWTETQSVSMGAKTIEFTDVPEGPVTVIIKDSEGRYHPGSIVINGSIVIVSFEPLEYAADITLKVG